MTDREPQEPLVKRGTVLQIGDRRAEVDSIQRWFVLVRVEGLRRFGPCRSRRLNRLFRTPPTRKDSTMLCLTRRSGQKVLIGDNITVTVLRTWRQIMLGFEAPTDVAIMRSEVVGKEIRQDASAGRNG
jgi:carbon storage regulator